MASTQDWNWWKLAGKIQPNLHGMGTEKQGPLLVTLEALKVFFTDPSEPNYIDLMLERKKL